jgi:hypothetical protein
MVSLFVAASGAGTYVNWGVVHVSVANLLIIVLMLVVFVAALLIPFPKGHEEPPRPTASRGADAADEGEVET